MDWFPYDNGPRHERVKKHFEEQLTRFIEIRYINWNEYFIEEFNIYFC